MYFLFQLKLEITVSDGCIFKTYHRLVFLLKMPYHLIFIVNTFFTIDKKKYIFSFLECSTGTAHFREPRSANPTTDRFNQG